MPRPDSAPRQVVPVEPPRPGRERAALALLTALWIQATLLAGAADPGRSGGLDLDPDEVAFDQLTPAHQRGVREVLAAVDELCLLQGEAGRWPTPEALGAEWLSPFEAGSGYRWSYDALGPTASYLALPADPDPGDEGARPWLLLELSEGLAASQDPTHADQALRARDHRRVVDGRVMHFSLWVGPGDDEPPRSIPRTPALQGWQQVVVRRSS